MGEIYKKQDIIQGYLFKTKSILNKTYKVIFYDYEELKIRGIKTLLIFGRMN